MNQGSSLKGSSLRTQEFCGSFRLRFRGFVIIKSYSSWRSFLLSEDIFVKDHIREGINHSGRVMLCLEGILMVPFQTKWPVCCR